MNVYAQKAALLVFNPLDVPSTIMSWTSKEVFKCWTLYAVLTIRDVSTNELAGIYTSKMRARSCIM